MVPELHWHWQFEMDNRSRIFASFDYFIVYMLILSYWDIDKTHFFGLGSKQGSKSTKLRRQNEGKRVVGICVSQGMSIAFSFI